MSTNLPASIHARLLNRAKERGEDFNQVLSRYATERFLYRLSSIPAREELWLKGAKLFDLWFDIPHRPTRDADFLGFGPVHADLLRRTVAEICSVRIDDGMEFDPESIVVEPIREDARYGGLRVRLVGTLGRARTTVQLDVGYGDAVTPGPEEATYPTMLEGFPAPHLRHGKHTIEGLLRPAGADPGRPTGYGATVASHRSNVSAPRYAHAR